MILDNTLWNAMILVPATALVLYLVYKFVQKRRLFHDLAQSSLTFYDPAYNQNNQQGAWRKFPSFSSSVLQISDQLHSLPTDLSVLIPFSDRDQPAQLSAYLREVAQYLQHRQENYPSFTYECILIDRNTSASQYSAALAYVSKMGAEQWRLLRLPQDLGEGAAFKLGVSGCRGKFVLLAPSCSGVAFGQLKTMEASMYKHRIGLLIGARAGFRLSNAVNAFVLGFPFGSQIDFECPFRLMDRAVALHLGEGVGSLSMAYLLEMVCLARSGGIPTHWVKMGTHHSKSLTPCLSTFVYLEARVCSVLSRLGML